LPAHIPVGEVEDRYAWELEAFHAIDAEICEVAAASEDEFVRFAHDADALITSWGLPDHATYHRRITTLRGHRSWLRGRRYG
jgi:hypothetical protein